MKALFRILRHDWPLHAALLVTNWLPDNVPFLRLRGMMARPFLGSCGRNLRLGRNVCFYNPSRIDVGCNVYIAYGAWFMAGDQIRIGDNVLIGPYTVVASADHLRCHGSFYHGRDRMAPIVVGDNSWLGAHVTLTAGSAIGNGSLVAAGAVVTSEIPRDALAGGVPARVLRTLTDESD